MDVRYIGPQAEVTIEETGDLVQRNHKVTVSDDLGRRLIEQGTWERVKPEPKKKGSGS